MVPSCIGDLPEEVMIKIFCLLPPQDLKSVMLVSKVWMKMGEDPALWSWVVPSLASPSEDIQKLSTRRFKQIQEVELGFGFGSWNVGMEPVWSEIVEVITQLPALSRIKGGCVIWEDICPRESELIFSLLLKSERLYLYKDVGLYSTYLFQAIAEHKSNLEYLKITDGFLMLISPQIFASAIVNVDEVVLDGVLGIQYEYMEALFTAVAFRETPLWSLRLSDLSNCEMGDIEPALLGSAVHSLAEFAMEGTEMTSNQITAILEWGLMDGSKLQGLELGVLDYREFLEVDDGLVRLAEQRFGDFCNFDIVLSPQQVEQELLRVDVSSSPNRIILLSVLNATSSIPINIDVIAKICSVFGKMLRIVVERGVSFIQAMVEFEKVEAATTAKNSLHGCGIYAGSNTLKVEFARTDEMVVVYENNEMNWDFTEEFFLQGGECKSSVCLVYGLKANTFNCQRLLNIFLQFGGINKIVFPKNQEGMALIEMDSSGSVYRAVQSLNNTIIFGSMLRIVWSYIQHIDIDTMGGPHELHDGTMSHADYSRDILNSFEVDRAPSSVLHFYNVPKMSEDDIENLFTDTGAPAPKKVKWFSEKSVIGVAEFDTIENACEAMVLANNTEFDWSRMEYQFCMKLIFSPEAN